VDPILLSGIGLGECGSTHVGGKAQLGIHRCVTHCNSKTSLTTAKAALVDFTPFLSELLIENALATYQLAQLSQVYCLGSRLLLSAVLRAAPRPEGILGAVTTAEEGLAKVELHQPDLLMVSEGLEGGCGVELTLRVKRDHPRTRVLLLVSKNASRSRAREAIAAGCDGVLRDAGLGAGGELAAIRTICHGGQVIDRSLEHLWRRPGQTVPRLSQREKQVMAAVARGCNNKEIARCLILSVDTVKTHVSRVLVKLSARDRTHATVRALELGLLEWPTNRNHR